jgi:branched-chain amino acid transport system permease protein
VSFEIVASGFQQRERSVSPLKRSISIGLIFGGVSVYLALVGVYLTFHRSWLLVDILTLGQGLLLAVPFLAGIQVARGIPSVGQGSLVVHVVLTGLIVGLLTACLIPIIALTHLRTMFIALSPQLLSILTFGLTPLEGGGVLIAVSTLATIAGAYFVNTAPVLRRPVSVGLAAVAFFGLFQELLQLILRGGGGAFTFVSRRLFQYGGLTATGAAVVFICTALTAVIWASLREPVMARYRQLPTKTARGIRITTIAVGLAAIILFPLIGGPVVAQVFLLAGLYVLMGMGLNVEVGLAGLLDLGFVAFFAIGAYTIGLLTADSPHALAHLSFWTAIPIAVAASVLFGVLFGIPVLGIRGDYLAIATLGIGEIVRLLVLSDFAEPLLGGAQGILNIPSPTIGDIWLADPTRLYLLTVVAIAVAAYFAWRVQDSPLGRTWTAIRDDEDAARALGINLVKTKLLAYGIGAAFAGLAGAIFAVMLTSIFPHSFQLLISINILALIIVGGLGSLGGVIVGALVLIGLPELLREFGEYRFLLYGAVIVAMMRLKPEGLWPAKARRREEGDG